MSTASSPSYQHRPTAAITILRWLWCALLFILPLRWCYAAVSVEQGNMPLTLPEWLIFTLWPHRLLTFLAALLLTATIAIHHRRIITAVRSGTLLTPSIIIPALTLSPLLFGLAGLVHTTEWEYVANWYRHFATVALCTGGIWLAARFDDRLMPYLFNTVAAGSLIAALEGWLQHFGGLEENFRLQVENARASGIPLSEIMLAKMQQTRVYGHFADPNAYAAQLILTTPVLLTALRHIGAHCTPPRLSQFLLVAAGTIISGGALLFSGSRGALAGAVCGLVVFLWMQFARRLKPLHFAAIITAAAIAVICGIAYLNHVSQRGLETASVRMEYYSTALHIFRQFPLCGAGLGEYFPWHMRLKPWLADEARDPHSLFFAMLAQCGIPGAADAVLRLALPLLLALGLLKRYRADDRTLCAAALAGWCAWNIHALLQFNDMIIAGAVTAGVTGLFAFAPSPSPKEGTPSSAPTRLRQYADAAAAAVFLLFTAAGLGTIAAFPAECAVQRAENAVRPAGKATPAMVNAAILEARQHAPRLAFPVRLQYDMAMLSEDYAAAVSCAEHLTRLQPHRATNWLRLAYALRLGKGEHTAVSNALDHAQRWYPNLPNLWLARAALSPHLLTIRQIKAARLLDATLEELTDGRVVFKLPASPIPAGLLNQVPLHHPDKRLIRFE